MIKLLRGFLLAVVIVSLLGCGAQELPKRSVQGVVARAAPGEVSIEARITQNQDDASGGLIGGYWGWEDDRSWCGWWIGRSYDRLDLAGGLVYRNVPIPQGAYIIESHLEVYSPGTTSEPYKRPWVLVHGHDVGSSWAFSTKEEWEGRERTRASVLWVMPDYTAQNTWYTSVDISPAIQELVNRPDGQAGNNLGLLFPMHPQATCDRRWASFEYRDMGGEIAAPRLSLVYSGEPPLPDVPWEIQWAEEHMTIIGAQSAEQAVERLLEDLSDPPSLVERTIESVEAAP